jgi:hypothetical protein
VQPKRFLVDRKGLARTIGHQDQAPDQTALPTFTGCSTPSALAPVAIALTKQLLGAVKGSKGQAPSW